MAKRWPLGVVRPPQKPYNKHNKIFLFILKIINNILLFFNNGTRGKMMALGFFLRPSWPLKF
jgi:hypothetical protein